MGWKKNIHDECDIFIISGSGILDTKFANNKKIINVHPGIIPLVRGLDAFKWAILNNQPLGNTLHVIDQEVDKGEILTIKYTPVFVSDTIETLARRHYELEVSLLSNFLDYLDVRIETFHSEKPSTMRMNFKDETQMVQNFEKWKKLILK